MSRPSRRCQPVPLEVRETASLLERRWQLSILYAALSGALRFNEFADAVGRVPPATLTARLNELVAAGGIYEQLYEAQTRERKSQGNRGNRGKREVAPAP